jgi:plasmid stabilization system protein ParE
MPRLLWTPRAERHIEDIAYYIAVEDGIVVKAVFDATRDYPRLFREGE